MRFVQAMGRGLPAFNLRLAAIVLLAVAAFALVACGGDDDDDDSGSTSPTATTGSGGGGGGSSPAPTSAPEQPAIEGTISIEGSSTVQPFTLELIPAFEAEYPGVTVNPPSGIGSGGGITAFINKEIEIAQSSRAIRANEIEQAAAAGLEAFEVKIFNDALAIVVHPDNPVEDLTVEQVAQIFAGQITSWDELGGSGNITVYTRNEESGTFAYMEEDVIQATLGSEATYADNVNKQASAPAGLTQVAGDRSGIFYAGLGNLAEIPEGSVKVLTIEGELPSAETVDAGTYPISRGLFYYVDGDPAQSSNAALKAFIEFALSPVGQSIGENLGFLPVAPTQ